MYKYIWMSGALRSCEDTMTEPNVDTKKQQRPVSGIASESSSNLVHPVGNGNELQEQIQSAALVGSERAPLLKGFYITTSLIVILKMPTGSNGSSNNNSDGCNVLNLVHTHSRNRCHKVDTRFWHQFFVPIASGTKRLVPIYGVKINNGRRLRRSSFHPNVIITHIDLYCP